MRVIRALIRALARASRKPANQASKVALRMISNMCKL